MTSEIPITFPVAGTDLIGILHTPAVAPTLGVVIVVGGPQYRVGSHRQFILLARDLAARGFGVVRFDCRGMGDSGGEFPGFEHIEPDVAAAVELLVQRTPSITRIVLWGLCDATLAIARQASRDRRICGVVLVNPWVRSEASQARTHLKHYYLQRLVQKDFLTKLATGKFNPIASARALIRDTVRAFGALDDSLPPTQEADGNPLVQGMGESLQRFTGRILFILSGRDLTAKEFADATRRSKQWQRIYADDRVEVRRLDAADHTFSRRAWRDQVAVWTGEWIKN
ncbi:MAG: hydrolase 1, exosortase A system-associated [Alphaproteobacteria bacterium]